MIQITTSEKIDDIRPQIFPVVQFGDDSFRHMHKIRSSISYLGIVLCNNHYRMLPDPPLERASRHSFIDEKGLAACLQAALEA